MSVAMLIGLWVYDELSFNKYFHNYDRIGQVMSYETWETGDRVANPSSPIPLGIELRSSFIDEFKYVVMSTKTADHIITSGDNKFTQSGNYMQPEAAEMLTLKMLYGTRGGLKEFNSILLNESLAKKLFGDNDPMNKTVKIDNYLNVKVTGVYKDLPNNSEFKNISFIAPWDLFISSDGWLKNNQGDWSNNFLYIYAQLSPQSDFEKASAKIRDLKLPHTNGNASRKPALFLHPMSKWHLYSKFENGANVTSDQLKFVWFYGTISVFVLLLACINFVNLSTAHSEKRAREVGIRKAVGSIRRQLIGQFLTESLLVVVFAFLLSLFLLLLVLPWFNQVSGKDMSIAWGSPSFWVAGLTFIIFTGLVAGSYPAFYLSSFSPAKVLKGTFRIGNFASMPRKVLVVLQFTVSVILISGTIVIYRQIQFSKNRPVGYNREGLISINMKADDIHKHHDAFRQELLNTRAIVEMAESNGSVTELWSSNGGFSWRGKDSSVADKIFFGTIGVSYEFGKTVGWQFIAGRDFSREFSDDSAGFIINEAAAKYMGLKDPVDEIMQRDGKNYKILGVIKDMVMESPYKPVTPTVFFLGGWAGSTVSIRINPKMSAGLALAKIELVFKKYVTSMPFDYKFTDEEYGKKFADETRIGILASFFSALAILISCLGLFGLSLFMATQRTKEIGIRKVIGASTFNVWHLLSKDFVILVIISCLIAIPISYLFMYNWLQKYEYRIGLSWWIFAVSGIGILVITLLTVSYQAIKAATANPVKSLRTE